MNYLVKNPKALFCLKAIDRLLSLLHRTHPLPQTIDRILFANLAHMGDAIISTSVLPAFKARYPQAKVGFLVGSWNQEVLAGHPLINHMHLLDHPKVNRNPLTLPDKIRQYRKTYKKALHEARSLSYDVAVDLCPYFPNALPFFWRAKIPVRLGYTSGGFGPLLTHPFDWEEKEQYMGEYYRPLLKLLGVEGPLAPNLGLEREAGSYVLIHVGVGNPQRTFSEAKWQQLIEALHAQGEELVFTGRGSAEEACIQRVRGDTGKAYCHLRFSELVDIVRRARLVICPDTGIAHIAAALKIPSIVLFSDLNIPPQYIHDRALTVQGHLTWSIDQILQCKAALH